MCLVEVGQRNPEGVVQMTPRLVPACQALAQPNMVVHTDSPKVKQAQSMNLELLLVNHPLDCSVCDQAGECYLQDYSYKFGKAHSRLDEPKIQRRDKYEIGDQIALFTDRCVMCTRCVRFTREISGTAELQVVSRGAAEEIDIFPGQPCNNKLAGNVVDLCPVGALCSKDFLYKKRVWWLRSQQNVCPGCSTGCSIHVDMNENVVYRLRPRTNPLAQGHFMCDDGRFGFKYIHAKNRLTFPEAKVSSRSSDFRAAGNPTSSPSIAKATPSPADGANEVGVDIWPDVLNRLRKELQETARTLGDRFAVMFSPFMTCEEAFLLATYIKSICPQSRLVMGPIPNIGYDDLYPKGPQGQPPSEDRIRFTIRAEKCPNRRGVEVVLRHFEGSIVDVETLSNSNGDIQAWYVVGGYPESWVPSSLESAVSAAQLLVVQDILSSALSDRADFVLPGGTFAERDGTFVNFAGLAQGIKAAIRSPGNARADGRILMELSERRGLFHAESIRREMAAAIPAFAPLAIGDLGEFGVNLVLTFESSIRDDSGRVGPKYGAAQ